MPIDADKVAIIRERLGRFRMENQSLGTNMAFNNWLKAGGGPKDVQALLDELNTAMMDKFTAESMNTSRAFADKATIDSLTDERDSLSEIHQKIEADPAKTVATRKVREQLKEAVAERDALRRKVKALTAVSEEKWKPFLEKWDVWAAGISAMVDMCEEGNLPTTEEWNTIRKHVGNMPPMPPMQEVMTEQNNIPASSASSSAPKDGRRLIRGIGGRRSNVPRTEDSGNGPEDD